jgi:hypothetical protein
MAMNFDQVRTGVAQITGFVSALAERFEPPTLVAISGRPFWRHMRQDNVLLAYLKCVRATSSLNACIVLLDHGYVQEVAALCRGIDEFMEDVAFVALALGPDDEPTEQQIRLATEFFQEEFDDIDDPVGSAQSRDRVPRRKVHAGIARLTADTHDVERIQDLARTLSQAMSGFVHGAYGHIMELYGGNPPRFHVLGMTGTPKIAEWVEGLGNYVYRTMCGVETVTSRTAGAEHLYVKVRAARQELFSMVGGPAS